jgi:membrane protease subunit HflC
LNDSEKQNLVIDSYSRYRITNVEKFFEKLRTLDGAEDRIGSIITSNLKEEIAKSTRAEIIGGLTQPGTDDIVLATDSRQEILDKVLIATNAEVGTSGEDFGVEIIDVRIKRAEFPEDALPNIFARMRAERDRISRETRALGAEEDAKIRAKAERDRTIILADAEKQANITRGEGEGKAIQIFARALEQDPEFFAFQRSLEAYRNFLSTNTTVVLSSDTDLFQFLEANSFIDVRTPLSLVGTLDDLSGNSWTVNGQPVTVAGTTVFNVAGAPKIGDVLFVEGEGSGDAIILASQVMSGVSGLIESIALSQLTVDGITVLINESTEISMDPTSVTTIFVDGTVAGSTLVANRITEGVRGSLSVISGSVWTIGTTDVRITSDTLVDDGAGLIGTDLLVSVTRNNDDTLEAVEVVIQPEIEVVVTTTTSTGDLADSVITEVVLPGDFEIDPPLVGIVSEVLRLWTVTGASGPVLVDEDTDMELGAEQVGLVILVGFELSKDGSLVAKAIRIP